tara:strand:+ start:4437 stop:5300 length:864 start_codon:yes stop_codon:yes gene_type:complete
MGKLEKLTLFSLILLLVWGNMVSGLGAGLACPDWPLCFGKFFPELNFAIFMEHTHRVLGLIVSIFFFFLAKKRFKSYHGKQKLVPILCGILLAIQIVVGGLVVILQLETNITTYHFANAIIIFILIYVMCVFSNGEELKNSRIFRRENIAYLFLFLVVYIQLVLGAYVRHSNAGLACPDVPKCLGYWIPPFLSGTVLFHLSHRFLGVFIFLFSIFLFVFSRYKNMTATIQKNIKNLLFLISFQVLLGIFVVISRLAFTMTAIHLLIALVIIMVILNIIFEKKESFNL